MHLLLYAVCFGVHYNDLLYYVMIIYSHGQQKVYTNICNSVTIIMPGK